MDGMEANLEVGHTGSFALAHFEAGDPLAPLPRALSERIELRPKARADVAGFVGASRSPGYHRRILDDGFEEQLLDLGKRLREHQRREHGHPAREADPPPRSPKAADDTGQSRYGAPQCRQISRLCTGARDLGKDALEIAHAREGPSQPGSGAIPLGEIGDGFLSVADLVTVEQGIGDPAHQTPRPQRRDRLRRSDRSAYPCGSGPRDSRTARGGCAWPRPAPWRRPAGSAEAAACGEARRAGVPRERPGPQMQPGRRHPTPTRRSSRASKIAGSTGVSAASGRRSAIRARSPSADGAGTSTSRGPIRSSSSSSAAGTSSPPAQLTSVARKLPVEASRAASPASPFGATRRDRCDDQLPSRVQSLGITDQARGHHLDHIAPHQALATGALRIFHLLADRDPVAEIRQTFHVPVCAVHGNAAHRNRIGFPAVPGGEGDVEEGSRALRILEEELVEVSHAVEDDGVGMTGLDPQVLAHHRGVAGGTAHPVNSRFSSTPPRSSRSTSSPSSFTASASLPAARSTRDSTACA